MLLDNRSGGARGLVISLDQAAATADITEAYEFGLDCNVQGGAYDLESGNRLFTCSPLAHRTVLEYEPGATDPTWSLTVDCPGGYSNLSRAIPVERYEVTGG